MKINLLGAGRVGSFIAEELHRDGVDICAFDLSEKSLENLSKKNIKTALCNLSNEENLIKTIKDADLIINALPGFMGYKVLEISVEEKKPLIDVSFMPENPLNLDKKAREKDTIAIVDIGIAPGLSHFIIGRESFLNKNLSGAKIYVGGIPFERTLPFQYKAPFSPMDVLEEYTRTVRYRFNGALTEAEPLTDIEEINIFGIGTLEAFLTDGLRTLLYTTQIPTLIEKTLRYPGHCQAIKILKSSGFLSKNPIDYNGNPVIPLEFTSKILFPLWELKKIDREMTILYIYLWYEEGQKKGEIDYFLIETTDLEKGISSMAKTTGTPAIIVTEMYLEGKINLKGIVPPEILGKDEKIFEEFMEKLEKRGLKLNKFVKEN